MNGLCRQRNKTLIDECPAIFALKFRTVEFKNYLMIFLRINKYDWNYKQKHFIWIIIYIICRAIVWLQLEIELRKLSFQKNPKEWISKSKVSASWISSVPVAIPQSSSVSELTNVSFYIIISLENCLESLMLDM